MSYRIAGIDVHKSMLAVVIADVAVQGDYDYERRQFGTVDSELHRLAEWLIEQEVGEVVMESTAQYWRPVWAMLEQQWVPAIQQSHREGGPTTAHLHLAQAHSNRGARGRKNDFRDAERLVRRLVANELVLSFVPDAEQRLWRTLTRRKYSLRKDRVRLQNGLEALLEEMHIKLSGKVSDLLGLSGRRMLQALAEGAADPAEVAALASAGLRASKEQLCDALAACRELRPVYRRLLKAELEHVALIEHQMEQLESEIASVLEPHSDAVRRLAEIPGLGVGSAQQIIAEVGPEAAVFPTQKSLPSWVGVIPGEEVSAGKQHNAHSPQGNRVMRRVLNEAAHAAVKMKGSIYAVTFRRLVVRMPYKQAIWCIAHRICRMVWIVLRRKVHYEERGPAVNSKGREIKLARMVRQLKKAGYRIEAPVVPA
ncbi:MAG TPA: IS110 family transposase [Acidobacteriaceae bacterium]